MVDKRRVSKKDLETVAEYIKEEKKRRARNQFRKDHEVIWKEVDRQVAMKPLGHTQNKPDEQWESNIELGSMADASEVLVADVLRIAFPAERDWFKAHINITAELEMDPETGDPIIDTRKQMLRDNVYRSLLTQQHVDFGLRHRVKLSIKEALHHGSFVAVVDWRKQKQFYGSGVREIGAPAWIPHSMWNCYPDDSPYIAGTNVTYEGSMIIEEDVPVSVVLKQNWMNLDKVKEKQSKNKPNVTLIYWYGDLYIPRSSGEGLWIPNQKVVVCQDWVLHAETNATASSPIIYTGYERDDVRDPYYSSPLIKRSPTHKLSTHCANRYVEAVDLRTFPPVGYDANEPAFRADGGPEIAPKAVFALRSGGQMKTIEVADPSWALQGMQLFKADVEEGVGVDATRKGTTGAVEQTAFEVSKIDQRSEIRTIDFVSTLESQGLKSYLYLQHDLNKQKLGPYGFYNTHLNTPDFITADKSDVNDWAKEVHFEITGSKGVLGEERRRQGTLEVTAFFASTPGFSESLAKQEIMQDAYRDVGVKDPERYLVFSDEDPKVQAVTEQYEAQIQELQDALQESQQTAQMMPLVEERHKSEKAKLVAEKAVRDSENKLLEEQLQLVIKKNQAETQLLAIRERLINEFRSQEKQLEQGKQQLMKDSEDRATKQTSEVEGKVSGIAQLLEEERTIMADMLEFLNQEKEVRQQRDERVKQFINANGTPEAQEFVNGL